MSLLAIIIYETVYTFLYFGILFSQSTLANYFGNPSLFIKFLFLLILFSGFSLPYLVKLLKIKLRTKHYTFLIIALCLTYVLSSYFYYASIFTKRFFHSSLWLAPRDQEVTIPKPEGTFRILCLGGSTTEGEHDAMPYPLILGQMLNKEYPDKTIEVLNAGRFFYTTQNLIIQYLFHLKEIQPDLIILFEAINDILPSFVSPPYSSAPFRSDYGHYYGPLANIAYPCLFEDFLGSFFFADLRKQKLTAVSFSDFKSLNSFRRNLETFAEIANCQGVQLILSNQAHCFSPENTENQKILPFISEFLVTKNQYADEASWNTAMNLFNNGTLETAERYLVPFVDQQEAFKDNRHVFTDGVHMTIEGVHLKAQLFFNKIVELKLISHTPPAKPEA